MSDDQSFGTQPGPTDAGAGTTNGATTPMPPTQPIGSESVETDPGATSGSPLGKAGGATADAVKDIGSRLREVGDRADLDQFADEAKRVTGEWTEKVKAEYRRRPGVVVGVAITGVVALIGIVRALRRHR